MKLSWCYGHSGEREEQQVKESRGIKQRQVREMAKCVLISGAKIREAGNKHGFIPSTGERDSAMVL